MLKILVPVLQRHFLFYAPIFGIYFCDNTKRKLEQFGNLEIEDVMPPPTSTGVREARAILNFWYGLQEYGSVSESILSVKLSDFLGGAPEGTGTQGEKRKKGAVFTAKVFTKKK